MAAAWIVLAADLGLVPAAFAVALAGVAFAVAGLVAVAFAVTGVAVLALVVALAGASPIASAIKLEFVALAVASTLPGPEPHQTDHLSTEEPRRWATNERHEGPGHIGPCILDFELYPQ